MNRFKISLRLCEIHGSLAIRESSRNLYFDSRGKFNQRLPSAKAVAKQMLPVLDTSGLITFDFSYSN